MQFRIVTINLFYDSVKLNVNHTCLFMQGLNTNTLNLVVCASALSCFIIEIQFLDIVIIMKPRGHLTHVQVTVFHFWLFCLNLLVYLFKYNLNYSSFHSVHFVRTRWSFLQKPTVLTNYISTILFFIYKLTKFKLWQKSLKQ